MGAGCPSRTEIEAYTWLNNTPLPKEICDREPALWDYGFYRKLNDGTYEFKSFCEEDAGDWLGVHKRDFQRLLDKYLPEKRKGS